MNTASGIALLKSKLSRLSILLHSHRSACTADIKNDESIIDFLESSHRSLASTTASLASKLKRHLCQSRSYSQKMLCDRYDRKCLMPDNDGIRMPGSIEIDDRLERHKVNSLSLKDWDSLKNVRNRGRGDRPVQTQKSDTYSKRGIKLGLYFKGNSQDFKPEAYLKAKTSRAYESRTTIDMIKKKSFTPKAINTMQSIGEPFGKYFNSNRDDLLKKYSITHRNINISRPRNVTLIIAPEKSKHTLYKRERHSEDFSSAASRRGSGNHIRDLSESFAKPSKFKETSRLTVKDLPPKSPSPRKHEFLQNIPPEHLRKESIPERNNTLEKAIIPSPISTAKVENQSEWMRPEPAFSETCDPQMASHFMIDSNIGDDIPVDIDRVKRKMIENISSPYEKQHETSRLPIKQTGYNMSFKDLVSTQKLEIHLNVNESNKSRTMVDLFRMCGESPIGRNPFNRDTTNNHSHGATDPRDTPNLMNIESMHNKSISSEFPSVKDFNPKTTSILDQDSSCIHENQSSFCKNIAKSGRDSTKNKGLDQSNSIEKEELEPFKKPCSKKSSQITSNKSGAKTIKQDSHLDSTIPLDPRADMTAESILKNLAKSANINKK